MPSPAFEIDTAVMTNQPSHIDVDPPEGEYHPTVDGGWVVSPKAKGNVITVTWGVQAMKLAAIAELRSKRGTTYSHVIEFIDPSGSTQTFSVLIPPIKYSILTNENYGKLTLIMKEQP